MSSSEELCLICMERVDIECQPVAMVGKCNHPGSVMHARCLQRWLKKSHTCPICRVRVEVEDVYSNEEGGARRVSTGFSSGVVEVQPELMDVPSVAEEPEEPRPARGINDRLAVVATCLLILLVVACLTTVWIIEEMAGRREKRSAG